MSKNIQIKYNAPEISAITEIPKIFDGREVVYYAMAGSRIYNLHNENSDTDLIIFVAPTFDDLYFKKQFKITREGIPGDVVDYKVHDIRQLSDLLWNANISFVPVLFNWRMCDTDLSFIYQDADKWSTMNLPRFFSTSMHMHINKMKNLLKGTGNTQDLIEKYGYDTKEALHAIRMLYVLERMAKGMSMKQALWFGHKSPERYACLEVKNGFYTLDIFRSMVKSWHDEKYQMVKDWFSQHKEKDWIRNQFEMKIKDYIETRIKRG